MGCGMRSTRRCGSSDDRRPTTDHRPPQNRGSRIEDRRSRIALEPVRRPLSGRPRPECSMLRRSLMDTAPSALEAHYDQLSDEFFSIYYTYHPSHATRQGLHQFDGHLGHYHRDEIDETLRRMKAVQQRVAQIDPARMGHAHALDHPVLTTRIKREIYWVETWRFWENNPLFYKDAITEGIFNLVSRDFAPLAERLRLVIARERDIPDVLQAARENLTNPPPEYTEQAIRFFEGSKQFFRGIVP